LNGGIGYRSIARSRSVMLDLHSSITHNQRLTLENETMETNETNETLFFALWNQIFRLAKVAPTSKKPKKCGIMPH
jgi:hypothetical protein